MRKMVILSNQQFLHFSPSQNWYVQQLSLMLFLFRSQPYIKTAGLYWTVVWHWPEFSPFTHLTKSDFTKQWIGWIDWLELCLSHVKQIKQETMTMNMNLDSQHERQRDFEWIMKHHWHNYCVLDKPPVFSLTRRAYTNLTHTEEWYHHSFWFK